MCPDGGCIRTMLQPTELSARASANDIFPLFLLNKNLTYITFKPRAIEKWKVH